MFGQCGRIHVTIQTFFVRLNIVSWHHLKNCGHLIHFSPPLCHRYSWQLYKHSASLSAFTSSAAISLGSSRSAESPDGGQRAVLFLSKPCGARPAAASSTSSVTVFWRKIVCDVWCLFSSDFSQVRVCKGVP